MAEPQAVGRIALNISGGIGQVVVSLWPNQAPKACRNFVQLAMEGYYEGCAFTRVVPGFLAQSGDPTNTGTGGDSIWDEPFADEISQRLRFGRRGILAMANRGVKNTNASQFFLTLESTPQLNGRHTIFGCVDVSGASGDTLFNLLKFNEIEIRGEKPVYPPVIQSIEVIDNPFDDIKPRITAEERKQQLANKKEARKDAKKAAKRKQGVKNASLLSFDEEPVAPTAAGGSGKMKSAHDLLNDARLSKETRDDRGLSAALPSSFQNMPSGSASSSSKRPAEEDSDATRKLSKRSKGRHSSSEEEKEEYHHDKSHKSKGKSKPTREQQPEVTQGERRKAEIEELQASLLGTRKRDQKKVDAGEEKQADRFKGGLSGKELIAAQKALFLESGQADQGKKRASASASAASVHPSRKAIMAESDTPSTAAESIQDFKQELKERRRQAEVEALQARKDGGTAQASAPGTQEEQDETGYAGEILEEDDVDDNDMSFLTHSLKFRKDVTADRNQLDELVTIDPRAEREAANRDFTLEDAKHEEDRRRRHGKAPGGRDDGRERRYREDGSSRRDSRRSDGRERDWKGRDVGAGSSRDGGGRSHNYRERSPRRPGEGW